MMNSVSSGCTETSRDMRGSQMALELRKFFAPQHSNNATAETAFNDSLNSDGALDAYAETIVWRLRGVHAMVSLVDRGTQYFLAGAVRTGKLGIDEEVITTCEWFGCQTVPTPGGLCENTLALDSAKEEYPCFIVNDLSQDPKFASLPVVNGQIAAYRFYAGTPITTSHGVNIGSLFFFDDKPRGDLPRNQRKFMHRQAANVMKHLETKQEAAERRRAALMSKSVAQFLERTSRDSYLGSDGASDPEDEYHDERCRPKEEKRKQEDTLDRTGSLSPEASPREKASVLDKIRTTLDHAADILRESLEISSGGVVFLDTSIGHVETENANAYVDPTGNLGSQMERSHRADEGYQGSNGRRLRQDTASTGRHLSQGAIWSSTDKYKASKILAMSSGKSASWDPNSGTLDTKTLQSLIKSYPHGNVWYIDDEGYFSSLEQTNEWEQRNTIRPSGKRRSSSSVCVTKKEAEAAILSRIFHGARQIMFLPLWDAGGNRYYAGCFVWNESSVPVFTADSEIPYLSAFTNSLMVEISRLDAVTSNKMKSDFISSISRMTASTEHRSLQLMTIDEFRSPLHGILASAEFLRESELNASQMEFISTIHNCSGTLLDTINHVLDYSKINSFERTGHHQDTIRNELYQDTNVALLCEDIVNGMIAANEFRGAGSSHPSISTSAELLSRSDHRSHNPHHPPLEVILDIEKQDWEFKVQPGALRQVVMNIFGNAQKYTETGYIMIQLKVKESQPIVGESDETGSCLSLHIRDTGKGMSSKYMERKLYHPFAQEDPFAPGVGLGLSIVWSIVNQLGGKISIRSELGKGTDVEVTIPVEKAHNFEVANGGFKDPSNITANAEQCIVDLRRRAAGRSITLSRREELTQAARYKDISWACIQNYCSEWFGFEIKEASGDIIITDRQETAKSVDEQRVLIVHHDMGCPTKQDGVNSQSAIGSISSPIGPFKLARCLLALLDQQIHLPRKGHKHSTSQTDATTQTPLGSPEERTIMDGIILTDYGFTPPPITSNIYNTPNTHETEIRNVSTTSWTFASLNAISTRPQPPSPTFPQLPSLPMTLTLPRNPKTITPLPDPTISNSLHILAVDDNALNLQLLQRYLLKREEDTIVMARNGVEAMEAVRYLGNRENKGFDVVFMDITMPEMDGFEATRQIRAYERTQIQKRNERILNEKDLQIAKTNELDGTISKRDLGRGKQAYIVALTGLASRRDRDLAKECGFDDFLTKPFSFKKIGELLKRLSGENVRG